MVLLSESDVDETLLAVVEVDDSMPLDANVVELLDTYSAVSLDTAAGKRSE